MKAAASILIPFPVSPPDGGRVGGEPDAWAVARVGVAPDGVRTVLEALAPWGVNYYPAGPGRGVLSLTRPDGEWLEPLRVLASDGAATIEIVPHEEYDASWRLPEEPIEIGPGLRVGRTASPRGDDVIAIDPGLAFGDCRHPTTRLCATAVQERARLAPLDSLLDVGTGSGIFALVAAHLGVPTVDAVDNDPYCRYVTRANAARNSATIGVFGELPTGPYDFVVANIWASAFAELSAPLTRRLRDGGTLFVSGFATSEADEVIAAFRDLSVTVREDSGWCALSMRRP